MKKQIAIAGLLGIGVWLGLRLSGADTSVNGPVEEVVAAETRPFDQQHARIVWVRQVVGSGDDPFALGPHFVLMGLDTRDGKGERVILADTSNYCRPILTPDGQRVVYSNRQDGRIHMVGFDGAGHRELIEGFAVDVWRDPATGHDWLYYLFDVQQVETTHGGPLNRCRLDQPGIGERVWDRSRITTDNFQLSADGTRAAGLFPWPKAGMLDLREGTMVKTGKGCWTSMAPDDSHMMWIFDGAHKNLLLKTPGGAFSRKVGLTDAPGIDGFEVYHPRWSNHVRFMAMTGPYKIMGTYNAIQGGGEGINLYVGQFNKDFNRIQDWTQITDVDEADFFPDLWIEGGGAALSTLLDDAAPNVQAVPSDTWPSHQDGLVFVWENARRDNQIEDGDRHRICNVARRGWATYRENFEVDLAGGALLAQDAGSWLAEEVSNSFSLELVTGPASGPRPNPGAMIANAVDGTRGNFVLLERNRKVFLKVRTGDVRFADSAEQHVATLSPRFHNHVVMTYADGVLSWYVNGEPAMMTSEVEGDLAAWEDLPLMFGQMGDGSLDWTGTLEGVAIYSRALRPEEVAAHYRYQYERIKPRSSPVEVTVKATLTHITPTPTPESIKPYRAGLVEYVYRVDEVVQGELGDEEVIVQHWGILDGEVLPQSREINKPYTLVLQNLSDHPEFEGERVSSDVEDPTLEVFVEADWKAGRVP